MCPRVRRTRMSSILLVHGSWDCLSLWCVAQQSSRLSSLSGWRELSPFRTTPNLLSRAHNPGICHPQESD
uniref:Uncharacterized protein n=1 Tax=Phlebotomus papatasi TaxID=29031 RepID=A0A1B0D1T7_PHLPP